MYFSIHLGAGFQKLSKIYYFLQSTLRKIWAVLISLALSFLFISRCIYNIVSVVHSNGWKLTAEWNLPSDQVCCYPYNM